MRPSPVVPKPTSPLWRWIDDPYLRLAAVGIVFAISAGVWLIARMIGVGDPLLPLCLLADVGAVLGFIGLSIRGTR